MSGVFVSSGVVLGTGVVDGGVINTDSPIIGYNNLVTTGNVEATSTLDGYPASNLGLPSTALRWEADLGSPTDDEYLTIDLQTNEQVDYIGIARHNFYTAQIEVSIEILDETGSPEEWVEVNTGIIPASDGPLIFRFTPQAVTQIRVRMRPGTAAPRVAILYCGALLYLQRRIYVGHRPITYNQDQMIVNHRSISGDFLGRVILSEKNSTSIDLKNITPVWYRTHLEPFRKHAKENPFFFAWRPGTYPEEVGFVWTTDDPKPANQQPNGMMEITINVEGIT